MRCRARYCPRTRSSVVTYNTSYRPIVQRLLAFALFGASFLACPLHAQSATDEGWNTPRALEVVRRGMARRSAQVVDSTLQTYAADGRGYIYFLLDSPELDRQTLVRTDQVALELFWRAPNQVKQRIIGLRQQSELPITRLYYYLDRLTVVQDNYGKGIIIADGDNVNDVPHPVSPGAEHVYDYRLADSLTLRLPGVPDPVRVHEIQVRPRDAEVPAVVGSVYLEAASGAVVRMSFTFTSASYVDPRLDFIHVTLENGLWEGRFWLPREQRLEIRRELPELDLPFGTLIRTRMQIGNYRFNQPLPEETFAGRPVTVVSPAQREAFPFEQPIDAERRLEGIDAPVEVDEIRREARAAIRRQFISGLPRARPGLGGASDILRYNRAEGVVAGLGGSVRPGADVSLRIKGGWAFGPGHPVLSSELVTLGPRRFSVSAYLNDTGEVGGVPVASGIANSLGSALFATDWTDPYYSTGGAAESRFSLGEAWSVGARARFEHQSSAFRTTTRALFGDSLDFRPVREIDEGNHLSLTLTLRRERPSLGSGPWGELRAGVGRLNASEPLDFGRVEMEAGSAWTASRRRATLDVLAGAGARFGDLPRQELFLVGGRGTLPGYAHRAFGGSRYLTLRVDGGADLTHPWLRGRAFAAAGWIGAGTGARRALDLWGSTTTGEVRASVGLGLGLFYDLLQVDVARGLGEGGRTQWIVELQPAFWGWL